LHAGDVIGTVAEHRFTHKIMIPFAEPGDVELSAIRAVTSPSWNRWHTS
jgi:V/A-type H+-transporting ATPase subunit A